METAVKILNKDTESYKHGDIVEVFIGETKTNGMQDEHDTIAFIIKGIHSGDKPESIKIEKCKICELFTEVEELDNIYNSYTHKSKLAIAEECSKRHKENVIVAIVASLYCIIAIAITIALKLKFGIILIMLSMLLMLSVLIINSHRMDKDRIIKDDAVKDKINNLHSEMLMNIQKLDEMYT